MIIQCENEGTTQIICDGEVVDFSADGKARVKKGIGEMLAEKFQDIKIIKDETKTEDDE